MSEERMKELLSNAVDYIAIGRDVKEQIQILLDIGFDSDELIECGYNLDDILDAINS